MKNVNEEKLRHYDAGYCGRGGEKLHLNKSLNNFILRRIKFLIGLQEKNKSFCGHVLTGTVYRLLCTRVR